MKIITIIIIITNFLNKVVKCRFHEQRSFMHSGGNEVNTAKAYAIFPSVSTIIEFFCSNFENSIDRMQRIKDPLKHLQ